MVIEAATENELIKRVQNTRRELLDLSARNRLISTPRGASQGRRIEIVEERSEEVFRLLVRDRKAMSFLPGQEEPEPNLETEAASPAEADSPRLAQPEDEVTVNGVPDSRHVDLRLQTRLASERLQSRLLAIYYDAQTYEQEQGVSILYLAMGFLKWYESPSSDKARFAPLLLIPVDLERSTAASRFYLRHRDEDVTTNLSLQAKLKAEYGVELPEVPEMDDIAPGAYFDAVNQAIADQPRWEVLRDDLVVWFFSFAKYLMYRDLDPTTWPTHSPLGQNPMLAKLLGEGFATEAPICGEDDPIDGLIPAAEMVHVTDADSSQAVAIEEVRRGRHLVIQGPPGTGKSQTITNLIASAVKAGKRVLFIAEKMAALEVVHSRLERLGLGSVCLELHSNKANKKAVLDEIAGTLALGRPKIQGSEERIEALQSAVDRLNRHADVMNSPIEPAGFTPYQIIGTLTRLYAQGIEATDWPLPEPKTWNLSQFREHVRGVADLQEFLEGIGPPKDHPWRGVNRTESLLPTDLKVLQDRIAATLDALSGVGEASTQLVEAVVQAQAASLSFERVKQLTELASRIIEAPPMDRQAFSHPVWASQIEEITRLVDRGRANAGQRTEINARWVVDAWFIDLSPIRRILESHGRSIIRWFYKDYRESVALLRRVLKIGLPWSLAERLEWIDEMIGFQDGLRSLDQEPVQSQLGRDAFGNRWAGSKSDWNSLSAILKWESECRQARFPWNHREALAPIERPETLKGPIEAVSTRLAAAKSRVQELTESLGLDSSEAFGVESLDLVPIEALVERLTRWREHPEALSKWIGYQSRRKRLEATGLGGFVAGIHDGQIAGSSAVDQFQGAYYQALIRDVFRENPELAEFDGRSHERRIEEFRNLDRKRIEVARGEVARAHFDAIPRHATGGEMAVLRREFEKKRRHKPIRQLIKEAGTAILAIKPVFMMSPISVAQYLEPGSVSFDLLLIDEASQVSPVDALGAMARCSQVVVVGDDKQLPPTRFFSKMLDEDEALSDDDGLNAGDLESILKLCIAQGMSQRMLRWHYRSRHHSLIAVSNREFYDNRLHVIPSPSPVTPAQGLHFRSVVGGVFDRGATATNRVEAKLVAEAVIEHARRSPGQSLGVGAFSVAQRDAIRRELEDQQREHPELAGFFASSRSEPFFVKNLENIQGDERDVIFISVGYARDSSGNLAMNFGPLSVDGGGRRLNVLISRARTRCEVFSSITADDIDLNRAKSEGVAAFKTFLRYAATGILDAPAPTSGDSDADFEKQVAHALERQAYEVRPQVGTTGFLIDLAIVDASSPGRYQLGIECDGATYHSSRSARDRDRLRETLLLDRGWKLHRVWSIDWLHRPAEELQKLVAAIEQAEAVVGSEEDPKPVPEVVEKVPEVTDSEIERASTEPDAEEAVGYPWTSSYLEADLKVPSLTPIPETNPRVLSKLVAEVVMLEGPIHREEIARRLTSLWGQQRTGPRISEAVSNAIDKGVTSGVLLADSDFITHSKQPVIPVRDRSDLTSTTLKKPEMIPPAEIRRAIQGLVAEQIGLRQEELPAMVGRLLGFKITSVKLRETIEGILASMLEASEVVLRDEKLFLP